MALQWTWLRPADDVVVTPSSSSAAASLTVPVHPGHLWSAKTNTARNVGRAVPGGDAAAARTQTRSVTTRLTLAMDETSPFGLQAGLLLLVDENNYVKLVKEWLKGKPHVVAAVERDGEARVLCKQPLEAQSAAGTAVDLRLVVHASGRVEALFSHADETGGQWTTLFDSTATDTDGEDLQWLTSAGDFGVLANGAAEDAQPLPVAAFDAFTIDATDA